MARSLTRRCLAEPSARRGAAAPSRSTQGPAAPPLPPPLPPSPSTPRAPRVRVAEQMKTALSRQESATNEGSSDAAASGLAADLPNAVGAGGRRGRQGSFGGEAPASHPASANSHKRGRGRKVSFKEAERQRLAAEMAERGSSQPSGAGASTYAADAAGSAAYNYNDSHLPLAAREDSSLPLCGAVPAPPDYVIPDNAKVRAPRRRRPRQDDKRRVSRPTPTPLRRRPAVKGYPTRGAPPPQCTRMHAPRLAPAARLVDILIRARFPLASFGCARSAPSRQTRRCSRRTGSWPQCSGTRPRRASKLACMHPTSTLHPSYILPGCSLHAAYGAP